MLYEKYSDTICVLSSRTVWHSPGVNQACKLEHDSKWVVTLPTNDCVGQRLANPFDEVAFLTRAQMITSAHHSLTYV